VRPKASGDDAPRALDLLEDGAFLLASASPRALLLYAGGTIPFLGAALLLGFDLARAGGASASLPAASFGLALLFVVMKTAQALFCERLRVEGLSSAALDTPPGTLAIAARQAALQPWSLVLLPLAFLATVPYGLTAAFFQSAVAEGLRGSSLADLAARARRHAGVWQGQNHVLLLVLLAFRIFAFLNVFVLLVVLPLLLRTLAGVETDLSRAAGHLLSLPLLAASAAVTHLLVDPLVKAVYVVRSFHVESRRTGEDLLAALRRRGTAMVVFLLAALPARAAAPSVDPASLDRALDEVLSRRRFAWHLPKEPAAGGSGVFEDVVRGLWEMVSGAATAVLRLLDRLARAIAERLRWGRAEGSDGAWAFGLAGEQLLLLAALAVVAGALALLIVRIVRKRQLRAPEPAAPTPTPEIDLLADTVAADAKEPEEWLALGDEWIAKGDGRRAVRALYLAGLGALARGELVRLAPHKSNGDYSRELERHPGASPSLSPLFGSLATEFDRVFYGTHRVSAGSLAAFKEDVRALRALAIP
jgi:hypothetical protein